MDSIESYNLTPPTRFAHVNPGVSRGAYPTLRNFRFLSRLQLKTIVSLTPEPPTTDLVLFAEMAGIKLIHLSITRTSALSDTVKTTLISALNVSAKIFFHFYLTFVFNSSVHALCFCFSSEDMYRSKKSSRIRTLFGWSPNYFTLGFTA